MNVFEQDHVMMEGWYGFGDAEFFTANNLPARITANGYSVVIYGDSNAADRDMNYTIGAETVTILDRGEFTSNPASTFSQGDNFAVISGLSGGRFTITGNPGAADPRSSINGIQIIANIPEPSATVLLAIGSLLIFRRRR